MEELENSRKRGNEYTLEPAALNEGVKYEGRHDTGPSTTSLPSADSKKYAPLLSTSHSAVQFTPSPLSVASSFPFSSRSYSTASSLCTTSFSRSDMEYGSGTLHFSHSDVGPGVRTVSSTHSNRGAVFCKPFQTGKWNKSRPTLEGAEVSK